MEISQRAIEKVMNLQVFTQIHMDKMETGQMKDGSSVATIQSTLYGRQTLTVLSMIVEMAVVRCQKQQQLMIRRCHLINVHLKEKVISLQDGVRQKVGP